MPNVALAADDKYTIKSLQNALEFSAAQLEFRSSNNYGNDELNNSPDFCNFIGIRMYMDGIQIMLQDYSIMYTNVLQNSISLLSHVTINFRDFIDIYEYLDDAYVLPTRKLTNDDVDKTPIADMNFLD